ncbi:ABC transporter substrate-binding protein [Roseomonas eburnea]|uniref:ABC transporter substrate-binding protein n=1 Tax=Neoroseomonas eburnea TaxID=1346889 RepID=A0A9X9X864_9PROT|nr:ABC transporter substrate-binding protein [Neoroseomonas eburnea]MBR0679900.1 ABC transporter substrate-binding protein [Neoroseomonas eburnea]
MEFNRRQGLQGLLGVAAGGTLGAATAGREAAAQTRAETLRQVMGGVINSLDPTTPGGTRENFGLAMNIYDRLASFGRKPGEGGMTFDMDNIRGELAERIDRSPDGLTLTFHIRQGATWHDGTPVTAADVKWSLDRAVSARSLAPPQLSSGSLTSPEQFKVVGERQVEVKLPRPDRLALGNLCIPFAMMINSTLAKRHATADDPWAMNWLKENTAAGGAYIVETNRPGQQVVLRRNDAWKNGEGGTPPFFRRVILQTVPEASTRASLVERGDADLAIDLAASDVPAIESRGRVKVVSIPQTNAFQTIVFNTQMAPFDNPKVRQALAAALPYEAMFQAAQFGRGRILFGARWAEVPDAAFPRTMPLNLDIDRAKALLAEAGHPNGFATTFTFANSMTAFAEPMAALIKESLARIGVEVTVQKMPDAQISTMVVERRLPFFTDIGSAWLPAPDYFMRTYFTGTHRWNYSGWNNPEVAALTQTARFETDPAKYEAAVKRMINLVAENVPMAMVWQANQDAVMAKDISGYTYWFHRQADFRDLKRG